MKNRLTFPNVIGILLEHKKNTYQQYNMISDLFSRCLEKHASEDADLIAEDNTMFSRWCSGARPVSASIVKFYDEEDGWSTMEEDFSDTIIPNLLNPAGARNQMETLITESVPVIGEQTANELIAETDNAAFFTAVIRYAVLNDHKSGALLSADLSDAILSAKVPSVTMHFLGRKKEIKTAYSMLLSEHLLFITGIAGIGKSEFAKAYAKTQKKKYTNILFIHYTGDLKRDIAHIEFADDTADMSEDDLFLNHYKKLKKLHSDSLLIIDNFNVLPRDDSFFNELIQNNFQIIITTRCKVTNFPALEITELDKEKELPELFYLNCPSAKTDCEVVKDIITEVNAHTLTVCMTALTMDAAGMDAEEMLLELKICGLNLRNDDEIEIYKDEQFENARMMEHLRRLLQLIRLSDDEIHVLSNLSLLPLSGVIKIAFRKWMQLDNSNLINKLVRYGFITEDTENRKIYLHPLIQEVVLNETQPSITSCKTMIDTLHTICLVHGIDVRKPQMIMNSLISINDHIINDTPEYYLLFLQDMFPYFEKYNAAEYLKPLTERIEYIMMEYKLDGSCDKALLLDYKAELLLPRKEYANAIKKRLKAINIVEKHIDSNGADVRSVNLLSNLYNNLANVYLLDKKQNDAANALKKAFRLRKEYASLGTVAQHDTLQQTVNLANMMIQSGEYQKAANLIEFCETIILDYSDIKSFDSGICQFMRGIMAYRQGSPVPAETSLLKAENILSAYTEDDGYYLKNTRHFLYSLYSRWRKPELAEKYKTLLIGI